jgi:hypothetical protein
LQNVPDLVTLQKVPVTGVAVAEREGKLRQVERLIASEVLHGSESLCKLLRYLADQSSDHPGSGVKEYQIATEVFKRPPDFDPRMDSTVRVQTGRLRSKLSEYYAHAGAEDPWIIEIPKGAYALTFHPRGTPLPLAEHVANVPTVDSTLPASSPTATGGYKGWLVAVIALSTLLAVCVVVLIATILNRPSVRIPARTETSGPLAAFWKGFVDGPDAPWVVFSNAEFVGRPETGMHYFNPLLDKSQPILDHYTGVGEVLAIHELDRVFTGLHHELRVKRGRLLSMDDAKNADLIFVGSPSENLSLLDMPTTQSFVFKRMDAGPRKGDLSIVNVHPESGEPRIYLSTAQLPLTEDYAVVGLMPGLNPSRWVIVLAGLTTLGTQASVEYVARNGTVEVLLKKISGSASGKVAPFEAVLRVRVSKGVPLESDLVAFRVRK